MIQGGFFVFDSTTQALLTRFNSLIKNEALQSLYVEAIDFVRGVSKVEPYIKF